MTEIDYKFIMGYLYNENITCKEISDSVHNVIAHTIIDGAEYALDQAGVNSYNRYKDSLAAQVYYLSIATKTPYAYLYDAIVTPMQKGERVDSIFLEDIFIRSLFDSDIHAAVCNCIDYDKRIFESIEPLVMPSGKELHIGDVITITKTQEIISQDNDYYIHLYDSTTGFHKFQGVKVNSVFRTYTSCMICESHDEEQLYSELVAKVMLDKVKHPSNQLGGLAKRLIDNMGLELKTNPELVIKTYYKEVGKNNVSSTIGTFIG